MSRWLSGGVVSVAVAVVTIVFSQWPVQSPSDEAMVRLSWRTEPVRVETCRTLTEEELAEIPQHMRRAEECDGYYAEYELSVHVDGASALVDTIAPAGMRGDRPVYVLWEQPVEAGTRRVDVRFTALVPEDFDAGGRPTRLEWSGETRLAAREVALITVDPAGSTLVLRTPG